MAEKYRSDDRSAAGARDDLPPSTASRSLVAAVDEETLCRGFFGLSVEQTMRRPQGAGLFHVKQSFADAEGGEDLAKNGFAVDTAGDAAEGAGGEPYVLSGELRPVV